MTTDPLLLIGEVTDATARLLRTAASFDATDLAAESLLPGWTRGHLLTHLARGADAHVNLLVSARTGQHIPPYTSPAQRNVDIQAGAARPPEAHLDDLRRTADRYTQAVADMPAEAWAAFVEGRRGPQPAATLVWSRLRELEVHHVDLAAGYRPADWSQPFAHRLLHEVVADLDKRAETPAMVLRFDGTTHQLVLGDPKGAPVITGPATELAAWLTGRGVGDALTRAPGGTLPALPEWM